MTLRSAPAAGRFLPLLLMIVLLAGANAAPARQSPPASPPTPLDAGDAERLTADYWIHRQAHAGRVLMDAQAIAAQNERMRRLDPHVTDLSLLPVAFVGDVIHAEIEALSAHPAHPRYDRAGQAVDARQWAEWKDDLALDRIPDRVPSRYGLIVQRADLRTFPTRSRVFAAPGDTDIDRFQESALFPGTPVVVLHESRDGRWWFVISPLYTAWIEKTRVALGDAGQVLAYADRIPFAVVTGATARTAYAPGQPALSDLRLDMGVRMPLLDAWPPDSLVNGQHPQGAHVVQLPLREADGSLRLVPALLPRSMDATVGYPPLTQANLLRQAFKFLGERYGWGHDYDARDCSGFVSEVYRGFGIVMPRNTSAQADNSVLRDLGVTAASDRAQRLAALRHAQVGDLVHIPGHVMMVIGHDQGMTWVIHDTAGAYHRAPDGSLRRIGIHGVVVTPLESLWFDDDSDYVDRITRIQRVASQ